MSSALDASRSEFGLGKESLQLTDFERDLASKILRPETMMLHADDRFVGYLIEKIVLAGLNLPVSQVQGFSGFTAEAAEAAGEQSTTSTSFVDLTGGPSLAALAGGNYVVLWGASAYNNSATSNAEAQMCIDLNGADQAPLAQTQASPGERSSIVRASVLVLPDASNTVKCQYRALVDGTAFFAERWLVAFKYSNL